MSRILKSLNEVNPHNYDSDIDYYDALNRRKQGRPEPDYPEEPEDPYQDLYRKQDAEMAKYRKEVNVQYIDKEGVAPNGERYNNAFIVRSKTPYQGDNEIYKFNDAHWGAKKIVDTVKKQPDEQGEPYTTIVYYVDNHKHGYWKPWRDEPPISKGVEFTEELMREGISQEDLADLLFYRLELRYPDVVKRYGHEVVGDIVLDVAGFHEGADELGTSDIGIMIRQIMRKLEDYANEQINELSPQTLASYKTKAGADASAADKRGDFARGNKRFSGIVRATNKQFANDAKGIKESQTEGEATLAQIARAGDDGYEMIEDGLDGLLGTEAQIMLQDMYNDVSIEHRLHPDDDFEQIFDRMMDRIEQDYGVNESYFDRGDYYNARVGGEYGKGLTPQELGSADYVSRDGEGPRGRPAKVRGVSNKLPADPFGRTSGAVPRDIGVGKIHRIAGPGDDVDEGMVMGVSTDASSAGTIGEGVNHSALQGWDEMDERQKRLALDAAGVMSRYDTAFKSSSELDDILHAARVKAQNQEDELNIGASGRRELQRQAKQDFEAQRQQLFKEKMEMERFAWEKANTEAERKHELNKIEKEYLHDLRKLQMAHDHDMQKILHADTHELNKMKAEFNMRQAEREKVKPQQSQQAEPNDGDNFDQDTGEPLKPGFTRPQSNQWHTSQQVGYTPTKPTKPNKDDVTDVEPKPNRPLALGNSVKENSSSVLKGLALYEEAQAKTDDKLRAYYAQLKAKKLAAQKLQSNKEQGNDNMRMHDIDEDWQKVNKKDKTDGMSSKAVKAYRRENPGSKLKTAVTTKPSKLKKGSKAAKRRKSFCARMSGMKKAHASAKTKRDPDSPINKALRRWNCESIEQLHELMMIAEQKVKQLREAANPAQQAAIAVNMKKKGQKPKSESAIEKGIVDENLGLPNPGTYEQETAPIKRKGQQERTQSIAFESKK